MVAMPCSPKGVITGMLFAALPIAIAVFPQNCSVSGMPPEVMDPQALLTVFLHVHSETAGAAVPQP
jgi:hypothetical protein